MNRIDLIFIFIQRKKIENYLYKRYSLESPDQEFFKNDFRIILRLENECVVLKKIMIFTIFGIMTVKIGGVLLKKTQK
jgi:hypothetical protein